VSAEELRPIQTSWQGFDQQAPAAYQRYGRLDGSSPRGRSSTVIRIGIQADSVHDQRRLLSPKTGILTESLVDNWQGDARAFRPELAVGAAAARRRKIQNRAQYPQPALGVVASAGLRRLRCCVTTPAKQLPASGWQPRRATHRLALLGVLRPRARHLYRAGTLPPAGAPRQAGAAIHAGSRDLSVSHRSAASRLTLDSSSRPDQPLGPVKGPRRGGRDGSEAVAVGGA
jgi:hypothetical protein